MFAPVVSLAEDLGATVTIHKLQGKTGPIVNTGKELSGLTASDFLDGITMSMMWLAYHAEYNEVYTSTTAQVLMMRLVPKFKELRVSNGFRRYSCRYWSNSWNGAATFNLPKSGGKDAVYVFVEQPSGITVAENNLVLSFPVYELKSDGSYTDTSWPDIHLYPKNTTETITPEKEITTNTDRHNNYNVGKNWVQIINTNPC